MPEQKDDIGRAEKSLIQALKKDQDDPLVLVLGPGAFSREVRKTDASEDLKTWDNNNKSLRLHFLEHVKEFLNYADEKKLNVDLERSSIVDAYIALQKIDDDDLRFEGDEFHQRFWKEQSFFEYPQIINYLRLRISAIIYIGYDTLIYEAARFLGIDAKLLNLMPLQGGGVRLNQYDPSTDENEELSSGDLNAIEKDLKGGNHVLPIVNILGVRNPSSDYKDLFSSIFATISSVLDRAGSSSGKQKNANPLKRLLTHTMRYPYGKTSASKGMKVLIAGADTDSWYSHLISIALNEMDQETSISYLDASPTFSRHPNTSSLTELHGKKHGSILREKHTNNLMSMGFEDFMNAKGVNLATHINPKQAFISFANEDLEHADEIKKILWRLAYVPYFYPEDVSNEDYWMKRVRPHIQGAYIFITVCTKTYFLKSQVSGGAINREQSCFNEVRVKDDSVIQPIVLDYRTTSQLGDLKYEFSSTLHRFPAFEETFADIFHSVTPENISERLTKIILDLDSDE